MFSSFISVTAWAQHQSTPNTAPGRSSWGQLRAYSGFPPPTSRPPAKSPSSSSIGSPNMAESATQSSSSRAVSQPSRKLSRKPSTQSIMEDQEFSTTPDPRSRATSLSFVEGSAASTRAQHPDLDNEVATLSTKLINAINHQTTLDDTLTATRHELDAARARIQELEEQVARQEATLSGDVWVRRQSVEGEKNGLLACISQEKKQRRAVEQDKRKIEQELENLTTALFEEANKMVISAKEAAQKDRDALQRRNDQLKAQLADTESLLTSQQEQLTELKIVMEQMTLERDDHSSTTPSSPGFSRFDPRDSEGAMCDLVSNNGSAELPSPAYPTSFTHLLQPVLRTDLSCYDDFLALVKLSKNSVAGRTSSGSSYGGLNPMFGLAGSTPAASNAPTASSATTVTSSNASAAQTPTTPSSAGGVGIPLPPLKETKFFKRVLAEDIEPTLRLDMAPSLSWLARRSVLSAMIEGTLVVEPVPTSSPFASITKPQFYPCSLCGDSRREAAYLRDHRFRTSEAESAQRYPLCKYCLGRVRSTCDFLGFLRIVKDGHWRADDVDSEHAAWEESVRLREQMFWSRIGGGVIPTISGIQHMGSVGEKSPRLSEEHRPTSAHNAPQGLAASTVPRETEKPEAVASQDRETNAEAPDDAEDKAESNGSVHILPDGSPAGDLGPAAEDKAESNGSVQVLPEGSPAGDLGPAAEDKAESNGSVQVLPEGSPAGDLSPAAGAMSVQELATVKNTTLVEQAPTPSDEIRAIRAIDERRQPNKPSIFHRLTKSWEGRTPYSKDGAQRLSLTIPGALAS